MRKNELIVIFAVLASASFAVFEAPPPDISSMAMADISPAIGPGPTSLFYRGGISAGSAYIRPFNYADFDQLSAWASVPVERIGRFSAVVGNFSVEELSTETSLSLGYTRNVFSDIHTELDVAVRGGFYSLSFGESIGGRDLGSSAGFALDMAAEAVVYRRTRVSVVAENLSATNMGIEGDIELPRAVAAAVSYSPYTKTDMLFHIRREADAGYCYGLGVSFSPHEIITFRLGAATNPDRVTAGIALKYNIVRFDYALKSHSALPLSHAFGIGIDIER